MKKMNINYKFLNACRYGKLKLAKKHLKNGADIHVDDDCALRLASYYGHLEVVKYLVEQGADIHAEDDYALREASTYGHLDVVDYLKQQIRKQKIALF